MEEYSRKGEPLRTFSIDLSEDQAKAHAEQLTIVRHPTRQRIIRLLEKYNDQRLCVFEMADVLHITWLTFATPDLSARSGTKCIATILWIPKNLRPIEKPQEPYEAHSYLPIPHLVREWVLFMILFVMFQRSL